MKNLLLKTYGKYHAVEHHANYDRTKCGIEVDSDLCRSIFSVDSTEVAHFEDSKETKVCIECLYIKEVIAPW